jgi:branched-subunit amino acid aminotransferase/4-amino-4-deoxychorismate lyase
MASPDVLMGAGLYETTRVSDGLALHGERHLERMRSSAHALGLPAPGRAAFAAAIAAATGEGEVVRVRLHAPAGRPELTAERRAALAPEPLRLTALAGWYAPGYALREHKLTSHFHGIQGRRLARAAGFDDALLVAHDGRVGEATNANVALFAGGALVTPAVDGLLPGVCRAALLDAARELGLVVEARAVALSELIDAEGVLVTSSPRGIGEALELDGHALRRIAPAVLALLREGVAAAARAHALALP